MFVSNLSLLVKGKEIDYGLHALKAMSYGIPVTVSGTEFIMLDKIYSRTPNLKKTSVTDEYILLETKMDASEFMVHVNSEIQEDEKKALQSQFVLFENKFKESIPIPVLINNLKKDFNKAKEMVLIVKSVVGTVSHKLYDLDRPVRAKIRPSSRVSITSDTSSCLTKPIETIDSVWDVDLIDDQSINEAVFIWGTGAALAGDHYEPDCKVTSLDSTKNRCNEPS